MAKPRIVKPLMTGEIIRFKELARSGHSLREICRLTGRSKSLVIKHVRGLLVRSGPGNRMLSVLELVENSRRSLDVLACDLGYANSSSLSSMLATAKRLRAFKNGERASWER